MSDGVERQVFATRVFARLAFIALAWKVSDQCTACVAVGIGTQGSKLPSQWKQFGLEGDNLSLQIVAKEDDGMSTRQCHGCSALATLPSRKVEPSLNPRVVVRGLSEKKIRVGFPVSTQIVPRFTSLVLVNDEQVLHRMHNHL